MATFRDVTVYLQRDGGWEEVPRSAQGPAGGHRRYQKTLPDNTLLRVVVPPSPDQQIGPDLLDHIVRDQLRTTMEHFIDLASGRVTEAGPGPGSQGEPVPAWLVMRLIGAAGLSEEQVRDMSADQARATWELHLLEDE